MYQSIDDTPDELEEDALGIRLPVMLAVLAAAAVFALVYVSSPGEPAQRGDPLQPEPEARAIYLRAIGETDPALRRARLQDFLNTHPEDPRAPATQAQLYVLDAEEARAWQSAVSAAYDPKLTQEERRAAVEAFRADWGRYLGGREQDVTALLARIEGVEDDRPQPDRSLPKGASPFPETVPADRLAGGPVIPVAPTPVVIFQPTPEPPPVRPQIDEITPPRIRRNVTPRYPRKAQRRGVSAIVTLALNIDARGRVAMAEVVSVDAERYGEDFVKAAERAAMRTRFHPKTVNGEPTEAVGVRKRYRFESSR